MRTSLQWIKDLVPGLTCTPQEYMDAMTMSGSKVEFFEEFDRDLDKIVVGRIEKIEKHPDADKLVVCQVNVGSGTIQIVTGAPNAQEGALVPVVLDGGRVAGGHDGTRTEGGIKIKAGKLRGVPSNGMMCSIEELGSSRDLFPEAPESGLYIFAPESGVQPGDDAIEALGLHDTAIEYEITSNRVDCFSILGLAREAAATFHLDKKFPYVPATGDSDDVNNYISAEIVDDDLCSRYTARVVKDVKIAPSPAWMQKRLRSQGIRPINNLVDITNYVMLEYGQPMHAYDLDTIAGHKLSVKRASDGDVFTTLDGQERNVDHDTLMICDAVKPVALAGIKGGKNSMIPLETKELPYILFESACFEGNNIRKSERRHGIQTESSAKFNKGLDPELAELAVTRAVQLIQEFGCGEVLEGEVDVYPNPVTAKMLPFEPDKMTSLLGVDISVEEQLDIFARLGLQYDKASNMLTVPTFRQDLNCMADLAEEIARIHGYDNIPSTVPTTNGGIGGISYEETINAIARGIVEENGFSQGMTYSFESAKAFDKLLIPEGNPLRRTIEIINPLGEDFKVMRTQLLNGLLTSLGTNSSRRNKNVRLYELGTVYLPHETWPAKPTEEGKTSDLPLDEVRRLTLGMYGEGDFFVMKGVIEELLDKFNMSGSKGYGRVGSNKNAVEFISTAEYDHTDYPFLHTLRQARIVKAKDHSVEVGYIGQLHPMVAENYGIKGDCYIAVINMERVVEMADFDIKFTEIAKYPASTRDLALVSDRNVYVGDIEKIIRKNAGMYLENLELFDVFEDPTGEKLDASKKSVAYSLTFRASDHSLSGEEVSSAVDAVLAALSDEGIVLRA